MPAQTGPRISGAVGLFLALLPWGLGLMGITVNVWLGSMVLLAALICLYFVFWSWQPDWRWRMVFGVAGLAGYLWIVVPQFETDRGIIGTAEEKVQVPSPDQGLSNEPETLIAEPSTTDSPATDLERENPSREAAAKIPDDNQAQAEGSQSSLISEEPNRSDRSVNVGDGATFRNSPIVTGDNVNVNTDIPEPEFRFTTLELNKLNKDDFYVSTFKMEVIAQVPVPSLRLTAVAPTVQSIEASPQRTGMSLGGHAGKRDGYAFTTPLGVYGTYLITVVTTEPEKLRLEYNPN